MNTSLLLTIIIGLFLASLIQVLIEVFKDKKVTDEEKQILQEIIIETLTNALEISDIKSEEELKSYAISLIMIRLQENNIQVNEKVVLGLIDFVLKTSSKLTEKLSK